MALSFLGLLAAAPMQAKSLLPLQTEAAAPLPSGTVEVVLGASYFRNLRFPHFTTAGAIDDQELATAPEIALRVGAGGWVEIQAAFEFIGLDERTVDGKHSKYGPGDARLHTKVRLLRERARLPALSVRFGTKLPNANKADRLGTDETDFGIEALGSKEFGPLSAHVDLGILLLGNPGPFLGAPNRSPGGQDDLFSYSVALVSRPLAPAASGGATLRLLGEVTGLAGSRRDFDNDRAAVRLGLQAARRGLTLYAGGSVGLVTASEDYGFRLGLIYAFELDRLFADR